MVSSSGAPMSQRGQQPVGRATTATSVPRRVHGEAMPNSSQPLLLFAAASTFRNEGVDALTIRIRNLKE